MSFNIHSKTKNMKNLIVAICMLLGLLVGLNVQAQSENWVQTDLGEGVSIKYPQIPSKREMDGGITLFRFKTADSLAVLTVLIRDLSNLGINAEQLSAAAETSEFWDQVQSSSLQALSNSKLLKAERIQMNDQPVLALDLEFPRDGKVNVMSQLIFVKGIKSYTVNFNSLDQKGDPVVKEAYFGSLKF